ncbi:MAG: hypothetical protein FWG88_02950 [Oscillospiraceae bacterium]|nr:hypothetical protein [Oscillospiraceae bacterium]
MKKISLLIFLLSIFIIFTSACKGREEPLTTNSDTVEQSVSVETVRKIDLDLTVLSSTIIYGEVYQITTKPDEYVGKTIKMSGIYTKSYYDLTGLYYHYLVIEDAAACCAQGIEFVIADGIDAPDEYLIEMNQIELIGVFGSYDELGETWYCLFVDEIVILQ